MRLGDFLNNVIERFGNNLNDYNVEDFMNVEPIGKIPTSMEGTDINMTEKDGTVYQCAIYSKPDEKRVYAQVDIEVNGRIYTKTPDDEGLYKLNINLGVGTYQVIASFKGTDKYAPSMVTNTIVINPKTDPQPSSDKKPIILGCDANTSDDNAVQNRIAERLEAEGYPVEKLPIGPNYFASTDYSSKAKGHIGIYLIASGIFSIADAAYGSGQFDNYVFGIRGDFGDRGATNFDIPIRADADCTSICDKLNGKTFNEMNAILQPYVAICGGTDSDELANNIINWLNALEHRDDPEPPTPEITPEVPSEQESRYVQLLNYFEDAFGVCEYIDDALEKIQSKGYSFYFSDGYNVYQTVDNIKNGDGANCYDTSELFYRLALGMNEKYGRNYQPEYLDVWCPVSGYDHIRLRFKIGDDYFYRDPACVLDGGDITDNWCGTSNNILEVNPSWIYDGD